MKRPLSISIIGWLSILAGVVSFLFLVFVGLYADSGNSSVSWFHRFRGSGLLIVGTVTALAGGLLVLKGSQWGRWSILVSFVLLLLWRSIDPQATVILPYGLLVVVCGYFLLRPQASSYFRSGTSKEGT